jgi:hypothetical protein
MALLAEINLLDIQNITAQKRNVNYYGIKNQNNGFS